MSTSRKIYINILEGVLVLEVSDGEQRHFKTGDVILLDDHHGKGHKASTLEHTVCAFVLHLNE